MLVQPTLLDPFSRFFRNDFLDFWNTDVPATVPSVNITEDKNNYHIEMAAPGLKKEDFNIDLDGDVLTISSEKEEEKKEGKETGNYFRKEYNYTSFSRSMTLPDNVDVKKIDAKYNDGILSVSIPKKSGEEVNKSQKIKVQ
jgi:HSP20 family protein